MVEVKNKSHTLERIAKIKFKKMMRIIERKNALKSQISSISTLAAIPLVMAGGMMPVKGEAPCKKDFAKVVVKNDDNKDLAINNSCEQYIKQRQAEFSQALAKQLENNIELVKSSNNKSQVLRKKLNVMNPRLYCAGATFGTINQVINQYGFEEYEFLNQKVENLQSCISVKNGLKGVEGAMNSKNLKNEINKQLEENEHSVILVVHKSSGNHTASGYHLGIAFKKEGMVMFACYNREKYEILDEYFAKLGNDKNQGFLCNITKAAEDSIRAKYEENLADNKIITWDKASENMQFAMKNSGKYL